MNKVMYMTLRQLTLFRAVAQHLSFTRAAAELCLTQPAVSIQIKQLEGHVGMSLFEQIGKRIYLTDAGRELYSACEDIFSRIESLETSLNELQGSVKGLLKLSTVTTAIYFIPYLIAPFYHRHPEVHVRLGVTNRNNVIERLLNNEDDLVIMGRVPEELSVESYEFLENPLVVIAPPQHPLVDQPTISLERLAEETFLVRELGSGVRMATERTFAENNLVLKTRIELGSGGAIKQGVMAGLGLSIVSQHTLRLELAAGVLKILNVEGFPKIRHWYVAHLSEKKLSLLARTFLDFLLTNSHTIIQQTGHQLPPVSPPTSISVSIEPDQSSQSSE